MNALWHFKYSLRNKFCSIKLSTRPNEEEHRTFHPQSWRGDTRERERTGEWPSEPGVCPPGPLLSHQKQQISKLAFAWYTPASASRGPGEHVSLTAAHRSSGLPRCSRTTAGVWRLSAGGSYTGVCSLQVQGMPDLKTSARQQSVFCLGTAQNNVCLHIK